MSTLSGRYTARLHQTEKRGEGGNVELMPNTKNTYPLQEKARNRSVRVRADFFVYEKIHKYVNKFTKRIEEGRTL